MQTATTDGAVTVERAESWLVSADAHEQDGDEQGARAAAGMAAAMFSQLGRRWAYVRAGNSAEHYARAAQAYRRAGRPRAAGQMASRAEEMLREQAAADARHAEFIAGLEVVS